MKLSKNLRVVDVRIKPAVQRTQLRADQNEGRGYPSSLDQLVEVVHHPDDKKKKERQAGQRVAAE